MSILVFLIFNIIFPCLFRIAETDLSLHFPKMETVEMIRIVYKSLTEVSLTREEAKR